MTACICATSATLGRQILEDLAAGFLINWFLAENLNRAIQGGHEQL